MKTELPLKILFISHLKDIEASINWKELAKRKGEPMASMIRMAMINYLQDLKYKSIPNNERTELDDALARDL